MTMHAQTTVSKGAGFVLIASLLALSFGSELAPDKAAAADLLLASVAITASPDIICAGQSAHITWSSTDATSIFINQGIGSVLPYGDRYVSPGQTTTYTITGTNSTGGFATASATVYVTGSCSTPTPTPIYTPTPTPNMDLRCSPSAQSAQSGEWVTFSASYTYPPVNVGSFTWQAVGGSPSFGTGTTFGTRFYTNSINETRVVTVSDGYRSATCLVYIYGTPLTPTPYPQTLRCSPSNTTIDDNERITFTARGGDGSYRWYAPDGSPSSGNDDTFRTRFDNNSYYSQYRYITVVSGGQTDTCTVYVNGSYDYPTPTPYNTLLCSSDDSFADVGQRITFTARGGSGTINWYAYQGTPSSGTGSTFRTRFDSNSYNAQYRTVTVTRGSQTATCAVTIGSGPYYTYTPTPYPYYPTPYPYYATPYPTATTYAVTDPNARITLTKRGRNTTRGQSGEFSSVTARGGDTLDFIVRIRSVNSSYLSNIYVTDILPGGLAYIPGSTTLNGYGIGDGITASGINAGSLSPNTEAVVKFSVRVIDASVPTWGTVTLRNTAQVRADGVNTTSAQMTVTLGTAASIAAIAAVRTGPADSLLVALLIAFLTTGVYATYTRTGIFGRRIAHREVSRMKRTGGLNFVRE